MYLEKLRLPQSVRIKTIITLQKKKIQKTDP